MKKILSLLLACVFLQTQCWALVGGPFNNGIRPGEEPDGAYSAVLSGKNLIGMMQFGVSSSSESNGRFVVFHEGIINYGVASGIADLPSRTVAASLMGVAALVGETTGSSASAAVAGQTITIRASAEGVFTAAMKGIPPQVIIQGKGTLSSVASVETITATGPIVNGNVTTSTTEQLERKVTKFRVRGSRTSKSAYNILNNYSAIPPLTPTIPPLTTPVPVPPVIIP